MSKVITFSRFFPVNHPRTGEPTFFVEQILNVIGNRDKPNGIVDLNDLNENVKEIVNDFVLLDGSAKKYHTIRASNHWKVGDKFSPRVWSGKPYASKQIQFATDIEIKKIWDFELTPTGSNFFLFIDSVSKPFNLLDKISENDGLSREDFNHWFGTKQVRDNGFKGQIICWNDKIEYS